MNTPTCPHCHAELTHTPQAVTGGIYECGACQKAWPAKTFAMPPKRHTQRGKRQTRAEYEASASEAQIQALIVGWLRAQGYSVLVTGQYKQSQRAVNDNGLPDIVVRHAKWIPPGICLLIEVKKPGGELRTEQAEWHSKGGSRVCYSLEDVQKILKDL